MVRAGVGEDAGVLVKVALHRYAVIAEALPDRLTAAERGHVVRTITMRTHVHPDGTERAYSRGTVDRWIRDWRRDPAQRARIADIRDNLTARVSEAEREGWHGEIEGLQISLAGAEDKLAQLDTRTANTTTYLDMPARKHTGEHLNV